MNMSLTYLNLIAPSFFSLMAVALFRKRTRGLCYTTVLLAIWAELIPMTINAWGLTTCLACLAVLVVGHIVQTYHISNPLIRLRMLGFKRLLH